MAPEERWSPRACHACVFYARMHWAADLRSEYPAGKGCFMRSPKEVAARLPWERYHEHWPDIPADELRASSVSLRLGSTSDVELVLMHKRRVDGCQAAGDKPAWVCEDCYAAFQPSHPRMCKYALANHMWIGRRDPLFVNANLTHQMLLALARVVTTKIVLRPWAEKGAKGDAPTWDFLLHQSGMVGSAIVFGNASCKEAMQQFPPTSLQDAFAVTFVAAKEQAAGGPEEKHGSASDGPAASDQPQWSHEGLDSSAAAAQNTARRAVRGIARLKVNRSEFDQQARALQSTNVVYKDRGKIFIGMKISVWISVACILNPM